MNASEKLRKVKIMLGLEVALEQMKLENGTVLEAEAFEAGKEVFVIADGEKVPVPAGEYSLEDGKILVVAEDGIIGEIKDAEAQEEEAPAEPETEATEEQELNEETAAPKKVVESISKEVHFAKVEEMQATIDALKVELEAATKVEETTTEETVEATQAETTEVELSAEPFTHNPEATAPKANAKKGVNTKLGKIFNIIK